MQQLLKLSLIISIPLVLSLLTSFCGCVSACAALSCFSFSLVLWERPRICYLFGAVACASLVVVEELWIG